MMVMMMMMMVDSRASVNDREEHRLHNGGEHVNLPANYASLHPCYSVGTDRAPSIYAAFNDCRPTNGIRPSEQGLIHEFALGGCPISRPVLSPIPLPFPCNVM